MKKSTINPRIKLIALLTIVALLATLFVFALCACDDKNDDNDNNENENPENGNVITNFIDTHLDNILGFALANSTDEQPMAVGGRFIHPNYLKYSKYELEAYGDGYMGQAMMDNEKIKMQIFIYNTKENAEKSLDKISDLTQSDIKTTKDNLIIWENEKGIFDTMQNYTLDKGAISENKLNFIRNAINNSKVSTADTWFADFSKNSFDLYARKANSHFEYDYVTDNDDDYSEEISLIGTRYSSDSFVKKEGDSVFIYLQEVPGMFFEKTEDKTGYVLTDYIFDSDIATLEIPAEYNGKPVLELNCYVEYDKITKIIIPATVRIIRTENSDFWSTSLTEIEYGGTKAQWEQINEYRNFFHSEKDITVHCSDGDIVIKNEQQ